VTGAVLYPLLTVCAYYLGARAEITRFVWSRYPRRFDAFMSCAACSGFWYGLGAGLLGYTLRLPFLGIPGNYPETPVLVAFCSIVWTPILSWLHLAALEALGGAEEEEHAEEKE